MSALLHTSDAFTQAIKAAARPSAWVLALAVCASALQGCSTTGKGLAANPAEVLAITETPTTISPDPFARADDASGAELDRLRDEDTIRNAVTSADLDDAGATVPWANEFTGSTGTIRGIQQRKVAGQTCRSFNATRQSYDGVMLYEGDLCLDRRTGWWTRKLAPAGPKNSA